MSYPSLADHVVIASRTQAARILSSPSKRQRIGALLSIGTHSEPPPAGFRFVQRRLRILFEDETSPDRGGPTLADVEKIVAFARSLNPEAGDLLVHCQAGISRSSASALVVLLVRLGPGSEESLVEFLCEKYPECRPNLLLTQLADQLLATRLTDAWLNRSSPRE